MNEENWLAGFFILLICIKLFLISFGIWVIIKLLNHWSII
jgi:hypothetical protein